MGRSLKEIGNISTNRLTMVISLFFHVYFMFLIFKNSYNKAPQETNTHTQNIYSNIHA